MKKSGTLPGIFAALGMLLLILDSRTALTGAREGIELCVRTVIPSLFPFFVLSILLTGSLTGREMPILRPLEKLTGIPKGSGSILLTGLLGGYPVGAQSVAQAKETGRLSPGDARRMLAFCNNAGPAFLFGMASSLFPKPWMAWALWALHILSALTVSLFLPGESAREIHTAPGNRPTLSSAMASALRVMATVCGWVVLFRVVIAFVGRWFSWLLPAECQVILSGLLELTNGCCSLASIENVELRFLLCSAMLAFGGLCVAMQTFSVAQDTDLTLYFPGKLMQTAFSILYSLCVLRPDIPTFLSAATVLLLSAGVKMRKSSRFPANLGV